MLPACPESPRQRVQRASTPSLCCHVLLWLALAASAASAQPVQRPLAPADVPEAIRPPGDLLEAVTFRDRRGENVVAIGKVQWAVGAAPGRVPHTRAMVHLRHGSGRTLGSQTLRVSEGDQFSCRGELEVQVDSLETTDVDGDGVAEIAIVVDARCQVGRQWRVPRAYEDGTDLLASEPAPYGGDGELTASIRGSGLERGIERRWRELLWSRAGFADPPSSAATERARAPDSAALPNADSATDTLRWRDRSGSYALVVRESRRADDDGKHWELNVAHYRRRGDAWQRIGGFQTATTCTDGDSTDAYHPKSALLSDWDRDGIEELSFLTTTGCMTDYSPSGATLVVLEGDQTHRVQGSTWTGNPEEPDEYGGFDPTLRYADEPIHALIRRLGR